jgi:hypothetical protein
MPRETLTAPLDLAGLLDLGRVAHVDDQHVVAAHHLGGLRRR